MAVSKPNIVWPEGFDEQAIFDLPYKSWFSVYVESDAGCRYEIHFSNPVRLRQDLETKEQLGKPYLPYCYLRVPSGRSSIFTNPCRTAISAACVRSLTPSLLRTVLT